MVTHSFRRSVVWSTAWTLFIALAAFALVPHGYAQEAEPGAMGAEKGRPFQVLQEQIDELTADLQAQVAAINSNIASLEADIEADEMSIVALEADAVTNADEIAALRGAIALRQNVISSACPLGFATRVENADGTVTCVFNPGFTATIFNLRTTASVRVPPDGFFHFAIANCPEGWTVSGGGFSYFPVGAIEVDISIQSGNGWAVDAINVRPSSFIPLLTSHATCLRH